MEILTGLIISIVAGGKADLDRRAKRVVSSNVFAIIGIAGFISAVSQMS